MAQAARRARLVEEARRRELVVGEVRVHDLDGDGAPERDLLGAVHAAHAADADEVRDAVAAGQRAADERVLLRRLSRAPALRRTRSRSYAISEHGAAQ